MKYFILYILLYRTVVYVENGVIHIHKMIFLCVNCHNMRNLYHIHVIQNRNIQEIDTHMYVYIFSIIFITFQAEVKLEDLLNLSILISKGKEIN